MTNERHVHLATGILERDGRVLFVASRYPNHPDALWTLPGGRARAGELLETAVAREFAEEVGLRVEVGTARYVSESFDRATATHVLNVTFAVRSDATPVLAAGDAHVVDLAWLPIADIASRLNVRVVRDPLLAHLADERRRYFGFADAEISITFADGA